MIQALRKLVGRNADLALIAVVIGILTILFVPIPKQALDLLLIANLSFALLVLLTTFYTLKPVEFSTFPSLLLIATLFRLSLNIAATRLILSQGDAGRVIAAIGSYVVAGNYVTGIIVFLILVVVQYVVVTNGAQRVAEVAARFTLDSMPGQQMSIDADLNMGFIDQKQAQERRKLLEREANFYGAMDGASKFVKGDAIAGILILIINIVGGLAIGVFQLALPWREAVQTYTLLTIGDGIVTQIPALVISIGTGIIITRSASDAELSAEVTRQFTNYPKTLFLVLGLLAVLLILPGIPAWPVLVMAAIVASLAVVARRRKTAAAQAEAPQAQAAGKGEDQELYGTLAVEPLEVRIGQNLVPLAGGEGAGLMDRIVAFRKQYAQEAGIIVPKVRFRDEKRLRANLYEVCIYGVAVGGGELLADRTLAIHPGGERRKLQGLEARDPTYGLPAVWIAESEKPGARAAGYTLVDPTTVLVTHLSELMKRNVATLLTRAETERLLNRLRPQHTGLLDELIPNIMTLGEVQKVLQNLLREKVSIRHLDAILEVLADGGRSNKNAEHLTELVRQRLGLAICQSLADPSGSLQVLTLDPSVERTIAAGLRATEDKTSALVLEPRFAEQILSGIGSQAERMIKSNLAPVLLSAPELRRHLRRLTERLLPHLAIVSVTEVPNNMNLKSFAVVAV